MSIYHDRILPKLIQVAMDNKKIEPYRRQVLAGCHGRVLELGVGAGANFKWYPPAVAELIGVDPHPGLAEKAKAAASALSCSFQFVLASGESLPFSDEVFDVVVSTFTLCSVANSRLVMAEVKRVLKPGGKMFFLEHGLSPDRPVRLLQKCANGLQRRMAGGCQLTKDHFNDLAATGLIPENKSNFYLPKVPGFLGFIYMGEVTKLVDQPTTMI